MVSLKESHDMYFRDCCNSDGSTSNCLVWYFNLPVDESNTNCRHFKGLSLCISTE